MVYVVDIDGTICTKAKHFDYNESTPIKDRIEKINSLYDQGNIIIYQTARGMGRFNNNSQLAIQEFYSLTARQLDKWGCKHHLLFLGKPAGDVYVDDKGIKDGDFFKDEICS